MASNLCATIGSCVIHTHDVVFPLQFYASWDLTTSRVILKVGQVRICLDQLLPEVGLPRETLSQVVHTLEHNCDLDPPRVVVVIESIQLYPHLTATTHHAIKLAIHGVV